MAQGRRRTLGGPRYNKPHEVHDKLTALGRYYNDFYDDIIRNAIVTWDLDAHEVWVEGRFRATKKQMVAWTDLSRSRFHSKWCKIVEAGLLRAEKDGVWVVTMVIRKENIGVSDAEVRRMQQQQLGMAEELEEMKKSFQRVSAILEAWITEKTSPKDAKVSCEDHFLSYEQDKIGSSQDIDILLKVLKKKTSLSGLDEVISGFYKGIGQDKISKVKRERGLKIGRKLRNDGFTLEDIAFAVQWTLENAKEELYDFAIIQHTVGQSIAAKRKIESERQGIEKREKAEEEERLQREAEERGRQEIETHKANLNQDERDKLREEAQAELIESGASPNIINDFLLGMKENEILRKKLDEKR